MKVQARASLDWPSQKMACPPVRQRERNEGPQTAKMAACATPLARARSRNGSKAAGGQETAVRAYLTVIDRDPEAVEKALMNKS